MRRGWCRKEDLNLRPIAYEATALPTELFRHNHADGNKPHALSDTVDRAAAETIFANDLHVLKNQPSLLKARFSYGRVVNSSKTECNRSFYRYRSII